MQDELLTQLLEGVVTSGTGTAAALPDWTVAGKTGTTEQYGDAWFVGYTPQLVTAVWVGYPDKLRPMLSEFHGGPVAGGTFPALIWKAFMQSALKEIGAQPRGFSPPPALSVEAQRVTYRNGRVELDNGQCRDTDYARLLLRPRSDEDGELQAQRGRGAERRRLASPACAHAAHGAAADATGDLQARDARRTSRRRLAPVPAHRHALVATRDDRAREGPARNRARDRRTRRADARIALAEHKLKLTVVTAPGKAGRVLWQKPAGGRRRARDDGAHQGRSGRLR